MGKSIFEIIMLICFGLSWPMNLTKAYKASTAKGTSLWFILLIITGYIAGIIAKVMAPTIDWLVLAFYILNLVIVSMNLVVYFRNVALDKKADQNKK